jgi:hypothetical protein
VQQQQQKPTLLKLRGLPFQASIADVAGFLAGYGADTSTITMLPTADGRASGEVCACPRTCCVRVHLLPACVSVRVCASRASALVCNGCVCALARR